MISIRPYTASDKDAVKEIATSTAFFGDPVNAFMDDGNLFWDAFFDYFFEYEAETCWVAETGGAVIGFLAGAANYANQMKITRQVIAPQVVRGIFRGGYRIRHKTMAYVWLLLWQGMLKPIPQIDYAQYPANLHINVLSQTRGQGAGKALLDAYRRQMESRGIQGIHLHTTSYNIAACHLYERMGYRLLCAWPSLVWPKFLGRKIENRCYGIVLHPN